MVDVVVAINGMGLVWSGEICGMIAFKTSRLACGWLDVVGVSSMASILLGVSSRASALRLLLRFFFFCKTCNSLEGGSNHRLFQSVSRLELDVVAEDADVGRGDRKARLMIFDGAVPNLL